ncbi:uncharacterized protein A4U43_C04F1970 [Asparagus officinalis]|uniref:noroxomaritidine synthase n=1 Tax=Asparagus officinalis TaxID=4686 RepID=A0A5P1F304_ASPOF|nr:alkane hydroxylase MAH1-like [Asparagus officinalis]ONK70830.1 uncharacterized protein A4U43_C04F1970 [Asparagus officinalis]
MAIRNLFLSYPELCLAISCFFLVFFYYKTTKKSQLPTNWPVVGMLPAIIANIGHLHEWVTEALKEAGCTFKFHGPWFLNMDFLVTCDPANVNHIFNVNFSNYPKGDEFIEIFDILGDGIFNADYDSWKIQRKRAHGAMSSNNFRGFVAKCSEDKVANALFPLMHKMAKEGCPVDLQDVFLRLTFDLTSKLVFGVDPGCLSEGFPTIPFARAMDDAMEALFFRHIVPPPWWKLMRWLNIGKERKLHDAWGVIDDFVAQNIEKKKEGKIYGEDLLTSYMEEDSKETNDKFLRDTTVNLMLAGRDTTGVALTWLFWLLANNPEVKSKILDELRENSNEKTHDISKMVYLHAALCECLRLYPSVPFEHKGAVKTEDLPSGKAKSHEKILFSTYSMGRMEGVWGEDCSEFKPERWISEKGRLRHEPSYKFLSFNCGPRTCLGKDIAFTQMKIVAAAMISKFDVELVKGHVVEPKHSIILHMKDGLLVRVKERGELMENGKL